MPSFWQKRERTKTDKKQSFSQRVIDKGLFVNYSVGGSSTVGSGNIADFILSLFKSFLIRV